MKKVAATSGQRVSFAAFLVEGSARVGNWAGRDKVLNLLSRPPKATSALSLPRTRSEVAHRRIRIFQFDARKIRTMARNFFATRARMENDNCGALRVFR